MSYLCLSSQNSLLTRGRGSRVAPVAPLQRHSNRINCGCNSRYFQLDHAEYSPPKTDHRTTRSSFTGQRSNPPPMDWSSSCNSRCPSDPIRKSDRFTLLCLPSDAREAMVEPLFIDRYARDRNRTWPEPTAEAEWRCRMVFLLCDGVIAIDVAGCVVTPRSCALSIPLGGQYYHRGRRPRGDFVRCPLLCFHCHCRNYFGELPVPNSCCTHPPPHHHLLPPCFSI